MTRYENQQVSLSPVSHTADRVTNQDGRHASTPRRLTIWNSPLRPGRRNTRGPSNPLTRCDSRGAKHGRHQNNPAERLRPPHSGHEKPRLIWRIANLVAEQPDAANVEFDQVSRSQDRPVLWPT
jgi:hypothetical protein